MLGIRSFSDAWRGACLSDLIDMQLQEMWSLEYEWPALHAFLRYRYYLFPEGVFKKRKTKNTYLKLLSYSEQFV